MVNIFLPSRCTLSKFNLSQYHQEKRSLFFFVNFEDGLTPVLISTLFFVVNYHMEIEFQTNWIRNLLLTIIIYPAINVTTNLVLRRNGVSLQTIRKIMLRNPIFGTKLIAEIQRKIKISSKYFVPYVSTPSNEDLDFFFHEETNMESLTWAISKGNFHLCRLLHDLGLRKSKITHENLLFACYKGNLHVVYQLLTILGCLELKGNHFRYIFYLLLNSL